MTDTPGVRTARIVLSPIMLYVRLTEASAALARQIQILDTHEPVLAQPLEAAWVSLDDLIEQLPAALAHDVSPKEDDHAYGQIAYEAFDAAYPADRFVRLTWDEQAPAVQRAWEAAAQAARAWEEEKKRRLPHATPGYIAKENTP